MLWVDKFFFQNKRYRDRWNKFSLRFENLSFIIEDMIAPVLEWTVILAIWLIFVYGLMFLASVAGWKSVQ